MIDMTIHVGDILVAGGFLVGGWRFAFIVRDKMRGLEQTVYGSEQPPVIGLVEKVTMHDRIIGQFAPILSGRRDVDRP